MSATPRWIVFGMILLAGAASPSIAQDSEDAASRWVSVYGWVQTGDRLTEAEQWPLALGSYVEALQQLEKLQELFPDFEREIVSYRRGALESDIERIREKLETGEHDITMKYVDFIESLELGQKQRFDGDLETALETLTIARTLLEEIVSERPREFEEAMRPQEERLLGHIEWLSLQLSPRRPARSSGSMAGGSAKWGTTEFVKERDLPREPAAAGLSSGLFPDDLVQSVTGGTEESTEPVVP